MICARYRGFTLTGTGGRAGNVTLIRLRLLGTMTLPLPCLAPPYLGKLGTPPVSLVKIGYLRVILGYFIHIYPLRIGLSPMC